MGLSLSRTHISDGAAYRRSFDEGRLKKLMSDHPSLPPVSEIESLFAPAVPLAEARGRLLLLGVGDGTHEGAERLGVILARTIHSGSRRARGIPPGRVRREVSGSTQNAGETRVRWSTLSLRAGLGEGPVGSSEAQNGTNF